MERANQYLYNSDLYNSGTMLRTVLTAALILGAGSLCFAQEGRPQEPVPGSNQTPPNAQTPAPTQPAAKAKKQSGLKRVFKNKNSWILIGELVAIGGTGGYLISHEGAWYKAGGGVLIGIDGLGLCVVFVPGCSR